MNTKTLGAAAHEHLTALSTELASNGRRGWLAMNSEGTLCLHETYPYRTPADSEPYGLWESRGESNGLLSGEYLGKIAGDAWKALQWENSLTPVGDVAAPTADELLEIEAIEGLVKDIHQTKKNAAAFLVGCLKRTATRLGQAGMKGWLAYSQCGGLYLHESEPYVSGWHLEELDWASSGSELVPEGGVHTSIAEIAWKDAGAYPVGDGA